LLTRLGSLDKGLKEVPWQTLLLISGMSTFVELLSRLGLPEAISAIVQQNIPNSLLPSAFAASSGLLSAFSSSVGVALPVFFPIVEAISKSIESGLAQTLIVAVAAGSHLVDASPLSTLGALCLAQIKDEQSQAKTYRNLLLYSFCMIPVAALLAFLLKLVF
jgi:Na+/H+ antiporter NhaD/arsenite permease-like protein